METIRANSRTIIISAVLILGLVVTLYLVKNPKIFKSRADATKFQLTGKDAPVTYDDASKKFVTTSGHITIGIQDKAIKEGKFNKQ